MTEINNTEAKSYTPVELKVIKQIEFYFGDVNLPRDKFLQERINLDNGWIEIDLMLKFNRLSQITTDKDVIVNALKKVDDPLVEVHEDGSKLRRSINKPIVTVTKEIIDDRKKRSIYAKGLPLDASLDILLEFFEKFGPTEHIAMRKDAQKAFKGSCFIIYEKESDAKAFLDSKDNFTPDVELVRLYKQDYYKKKSEESKTKAMETRLDKLKKETSVQIQNITHGAIMDLIGLPPTISIGDIKIFLQKYGKIEWVDYEKNDTKARVRFSVEGEAKVVAEKMKEDFTDGKIIFQEKELEYKILEGDEEKEHWVNVFKSKSERNNQKGGQRGNHRDNQRGRGRGNRGQHHQGKRRGGHHENNHKKFKPNDAEDGSKEPVDSEVKGHSESKVQSEVKVQSESKGQTEE